MIRARKPKADDAALLRIIREELVPLGPASQREAWPDAALVDRLDRGTTYVWVPDEASRPRPRGFVTFRSHGRELFVDMLAIDRVYQGNGVGALLMNKAARLGRKRGCRFVRLFVNEGNGQGIRFYRKHGFYPVRYDAKNEGYVLEKRLG